LWKATIGFTHSADYVRANIHNHTELAKITQDIWAYYIRKRKIPEMTLLERELLELPKKRVEKHTDKEEQKSSKMGKELH